MSDEQRDIFTLIIEALTIAKEHDKRLHMPNFYNSPERVSPDESPIDVCGTAACVMGWAVMHPPVIQWMKGIDLYVDSSQGDIPGWASDLTEALSDTYNYEVVHAIMSGEDDVRRDHMEMAIDENPKRYPGELLRFTHLNSETPTLDDAIAFIEAVRPLMLAEKEAA